MNDTQKAWDMADDADVVELAGQLYNGLIHPSEYILKVYPYFQKYGLTGPLGD
jgi:hypothetical protein